MARSVVGTVCNNANLRDPTITIDRMLFAKLLEKGSDIDPLREIHPTLDAMMDLNIENLTGAGSCPDGTYKATPLGG